MFNLDNLSLSCNNLSIRQREKETAPTLNGEKESLVRKDFSTTTISRARNCRTTAHPTQDVDDL
ncbi:MAG: hypothetical protein CLLPBCKN_006996 [Chroococcidiopsis cubana SAG 39.79]|nr:hypothetical protein [Chroococcidiopsis cubana SAG 39.79]